MEQPPSLSPLEQAFLNQQRMVQQQAEQIAVLQDSLQRMESEFHRQRPPGSGASGSGEAGIGGGVKPKLPRIPFYNGTESGLEPWLSQAGAILRMSGVDLQSRTAVQFASLYLEGKARTVWDHHLRACQEADADDCASFADFSELLRKLVGPMNADVVGRAKLKHLYQRRDVRSYTDAFLRILHSFTTPLGDLNAREDFINGLKPAVMNFVRQKIPADATLQDALAAAQLFDRTFSRPLRFDAPAHRPATSGPEPMDLGSMHASSASSSRSASVSTGKRRSSPFSDRGRDSRGQKSVKRAHSPSAVRLSVLTEADREQCIREGRCFRCRQRGHRKPDCPLNAASVRRSSSAVRKN